MKKEKIAYFSVLVFFLLTSFFSQISYSDQLKQSNYAHFMLLAPLSLVNYGQDIFDQLKNIYGVDHRIGFFNYPILLFLYLGLLTSSLISLHFLFPAINKRKKK